METSFRFVSVFYRNVYILPGAYEESPWWPKKTVVRARLIVQAKAKGVCIHSFALEKYLGPPYKTLPDTDGGSGTWIWLIGEHQGWRTLLFGNPESSPDDCMPIAVIWQEHDA